MLMTLQQQRALCALTREGQNFSTHGNMTRPVFGRRKGAAAAARLSSKWRGCGDETAPCSERQPTRARDQCQCSEAANTNMEQSEVQC